MTLQNIISTHPFSELASRLYAMRAYAAERRGRNAIYNRTWNELSAMSNRSLVDIGIHRSDIPRIAAEAADMV